MSESVTVRVNSRSPAFVAGVKSGGLGGYATTGARSGSGAGIGSVMGGASSGSGSGSGTSAAVPSTVVGCDEGLVEVDEGCGGPGGGPGDQVVAVSKKELHVVNNPWTFTPNLDAAVNATADLFSGLWVMLDLFNGLYMDDAAFLSIMLMKDFIVSVLRLMCYYCLRGCFGCVAHSHVYTIQSTAHIKFSTHTDTFTQNTNCGIRGMKK